MQEDINVHRDYSPWTQTDGLMLLPSMTHLDSHFPALRIAEVDKDTWESKPGALWRELNALTTDSATEPPN